MAGDWIKVEHATPDKPEVLRMARELCIDRDAVFGKVMLVWMWFDKNSCNGVVDGAVDADVDAVVRHQGFANLLRSVGWLKTLPNGVGLEVPNFYRHNGETAKKRAQSNRRQSRWRNASVDARPSTNASTREEKRRVSKSNVRQEPDRWRLEAGSVLAYLNEKASRDYRPVNGNIGLITARLKEGASVEDCKAVIDRKVEQWKGGDMDKFLRPATLFNATKFAQYQGETSPKVKVDL